METNNTTKGNSMKVKAPRMTNTAKFFAGQWIDIHGLDGYLEEGEPSASGEWYVKTPKATATQRQSSNSLLTLETTTKQTQYTVQQKPTDLKVEDIGQWTKQHPQFT